MIVHGELGISRLSSDGRNPWSFSGADIFSGEVEVHGTELVTLDFADRRHMINIENRHHGPASEMMVFGRPTRQPPTQPKCHSVERPGV
jgi:hypothetical protein